MAWLHAIDHSAQYYSKYLTPETKGDILSTTSEHIVLSYMGRDLVLTLVLTFVLTLVLTFVLVFP
jgi:hypothetical protein